MTMHTRQGTIVPPVVYVPVDPAGQGDDEAIFELRKLRDGRTALLAYTALDRLVDGCGEHQPWVLVPADAVAAQQASLGYDVALLDADLPAELRHGPEVVDEQKEVVG